MTAAAKPVEQQLLNLPLSQVHPDPEQPRKTFPQDEHDAFVQSVKTWGVLTPITVRANGKGYVIVAGERRFRAAKEAKLKTIPALVREQGTTSLIASTVENVMRLDLTPLEEGHAYKGILDTAGDLEAVAALVHRPLARVEARFALTTLPESVQEHVGSGAINLQAAALLAVVASKHGGEPLCEALAWGVVGGAYTSSTLANDPKACLRSLDNLVATKPCETCGGMGYLGYDGPDAQEATVIFKSKEDLEAAEEAGAETEWCDKCQGSGSVDDKYAPPLFPEFTCVTVGGDRFNSVAFVAFTEQEKEGLAALRERIEPEAARRREAEGYYASGWSTPPEFGSLDEAVAMVAEGLNSLLIFRNARGDESRYVLDRDLAAEGLLAQFTEQAEAWLANTEKPKQGRSSSTPKVPKGDETPEQIAEAEAAKAERAKERSRDAAARKKGEGYNLELGAAITTKLATVALTADEARLIVAQIINDRIVKLTYSGAEAWGPAMFLRFVREPFSRNKKGEAVYVRKHEAMKEAAALVTRELKAAKTVDEIFGVLFRVLATANLADLRGLPKADTEGCHFSLIDAAGWRKVLAKRLPPALVKKAPPVG